MGGRKVLKSHSKKFFIGRNSDKRRKNEKLQKSFRQRHKRDFKGTCDFFKSRET